MTKIETIGTSLKSNLSSEGTMILSGLTPKELRQTLGKNCQKLSHFRKVRKK